MKIKIYRCTRRQYKDYIDSWTIVVPHPKWMREEDLKRGSYRKGICLGCSPGVDDTYFNKCTWEDYECSTTTFGKRVKVEDAPKPMRKYVRKLQRLYDEALKYNDYEHWEEFNKF